jgi:Chorismate synthase
VPSTVLSVKRFSYWLSVYLVSVVSTDHWRVLTTECSLCTMNCLMLQVDRIDAIRKTGNSIGGVVECVARNVPVSTLSCDIIQYVTVCIISVYSIASVCCHTLHCAMCRRRHPVYGI